MPKLIEAFPHSTCKLKLNIFFSNLLRLTQELESGVRIRLVSIHELGNTQNVWVTRHIQIF